MLDMQNILLNMKKEVHRNCHFHFYLLSPSSFTVAANPRWTVYPFIAVLTDCPSSLEEGKGLFFFLPLVFLWVSIPPEPSPISSEFCRLMALFFIIFIFGQVPHFHHLGMTLESMDSWIRDLCCHRVSFNGCPLPSKTHLQLYYKYLVSISPLRASHHRASCLCLKSLDFFLNLGLIWN